MSDDPNEVLNKLQQVATDSEAQIIEDLAVKAGYWWRCNDEDCRCVTPVGEAVSAMCGTPRAP
jgi:hypothetical protein